MGFIEDMVYIEQEVFNDETQKLEKIKVKRPKICVELVLEIIPEKGFGEVELARVRFLVFQLKKFGYKIKYGSGDGFQSKDMQQIFKRNGIEFDYISMDKTTEPYETFRTALYENRIRSVYHKTLEMEMNALEKNYVLNKVDHSPKSSKDLSDAVGQLVYNCHVNTHYHEDLFGFTNSGNNDTNKEKVEEYDEEKVIEEFIKWTRM
jgi:hypothetical protein